MYVCAVFRAKLVAGRELNSLFLKRDFHTIFVLLKKKRLCYKQNVWICYRTKIDTVMSILYKNSVFILYCKSRGRGIVSFFMPGVEDIDNQETKNFQIPGVSPEGMLTVGTEPCIRTQIYSGVERCIFKWLR